MGQYYVGVIQPIGVDGASPMAYANAEPGFLKLMEHSWWQNPYVNWFCKELHEQHHRVGWIGDYSHDVGCPSDIWDAAWGDCPAIKLATNCDFSLSHKYLVNHTMKVYLDCDAYYNRAMAKMTLRKEPWVPHPLPLLTAIGNGLGGGDYHGNLPSMVGMWFWHELSVEDSENDISEGYRPVLITFYEGDK